MAVRAGALRLFVALELAAAQRKALAAIPAALPMSPKRLRRVKEDNLHLTLCFLGDWPEGRLAALRSVLASVRTDAFLLHPRGLGIFPKRGPARVLWAGLKREEKLFDCQQAVAAALSTLGFAEQRSFAPHITLARFRQPLASAQLGAWLTARLGWRGPAAPARHFTLFASELGRGQAKYRLVERFALAGNALAESADQR